MKKEILMTPAKKLKKNDLPKQANEVLEGLTFWIGYQRSCFRRKHLPELAAHAINARIFTHQAWYFAYCKNMTLARTIALDALDLAAKIKPASDTEGIRLRKMAEDFILAADSRGPVKRLKNSWEFFRKSFFVQIVIGLFAFAGGWYLVNEYASKSKTGSYSPSTSKSSPAPSKPYEADPAPVKSMSPAYERPETAPNGSPWPVGGGYIKGYKRLHTKGIATVTINNEKNNNDAFVELVSVGGLESYPVRQFYIPTNGKFTVKSVTPGEYEVRYRNLVTGELRVRQLTLRSTATYYVKSGLIVRKVSD